ncbi:hypothetical protein AURDEDRAFT_125175 [Auricularia subglabra TFB-10046 SS5]|uniref:DUF1996 domain-containing protein n=1 Tax=Auricularia subglabra (strain TFB-10046 / SS5) TaxID=717982 RepID=J0WZA2_AURST|nr:hypothetical protein AURDEDRAFT_125175 [Auricularia subglabra TFB-10046 SS5]
MFFNTLALAALSAAPARAFWRLSCDRTTLVRERADPIVSPGTKSGHLHVVRGGSNFNLNVTYESLRASECASCLIANDKSNYWTPSRSHSHPEYRSHVAYMSLLDNTHPIPFISMFYEQTWSVDKFAVRGWDVDTLQSAIQECDNQTEGTRAGRAEAGPFFQMQESAKAKACTIAPHVNETTDGVLDKLPGCNPLQYGPGDATIYKEENCPI